MQEKITESGITKITGYIGNFVYQNDSLQYMLTPEGRTVFDLSNSSNTEQFFVKDHLGNVRSVVETAPMPLLPYLATYELAAANVESLLFDKVGEIRDDKPGGGDDDTQAGLLDGSVDSLITGTSPMLKVMAGDEVELQTDNYYEDDINNDALADDHNVMVDLITTLSGGLTAEAAKEGITATTIQRGLNGANWAAFDSLVEDNTDTGKPRAYLNYMLFDRNMQLVSGASGAYQVNGKGDWNVTGTNGIPVKIPEDGFIFIFINNHSKKPVWFDRLQVLFHRGRLKEEDHYYPFGLPMANIGSTAAGMMPNRRKYQGNEFITEAGLNWMSFGARQYDPQTGRFLSIDPLAGAGGQDRFSPYAAMGDQPAGNMDPNGTQYLTTRGIGGMPDETSSAMAWNLDHMKKSLAGTNSVWGNMKWDELHWGGGSSGEQMDMDLGALADLFAAFSGIGNGMGASSGYACSLGSAGGSGGAEDACYSMTADGGDGDGNPKTPMGPFPDDDASAYGPPSEDGNNPQSPSKGARYSLLEFITFENMETATGVVGKVGEYGEIGLDFLHYGRAAEVFGKVGTMAGVLEIGFTGYKYYNHEISGARASYEITGAALSIGAPYAYSYLAGLGADAATGAAAGSEGGPVGALIGAGLGATFWSGELFYDNVAKPSYDYMISNLRSIETHLGDGSWHP